MAFHRPEHAVRWCMAVQSALYQTTWPEAIRNATAHAECDKFNGLRVRMGMHSGVVDQVRSNILESRQWKERAERGAARKPASKTDSKRLLAYPITPLPLKGL